MPSAPVIYIIGGPNGAGKTTFVRAFLIDPELYAQIQNQIETGR